MDPCYAEIIHSFGNDIDDLWRDKQAYSSVKSPEPVSIEDGNYCSYQRFMLSTTRGTTDNPSISNQDWRSAASQPLSLIDRLAKTASIWTMPGITRVEADKILQDFEPGIFIVRMNSEHKTMVLSYRMEQKTQHVMIKVNLQKGFYMDGSQNIFRNVNLMIEYYMKHPIQAPTLKLKLPRALMEAHEAVHFHFFENMKINFWTTLLAQKSVNDIWAKPVQEIKTTTQTDEEHSDHYPPLPPRVYQSGEVHMIQGLADIEESDNEYQKIVKKNRKPSPAVPAPLPKSVPIVDQERGTSSNDEQVYSQIWQWQSDGNVPEIAQECDLPDIDLCFTIPSIIEKYYPQLIYADVKLPDTTVSFPSLKDELLSGKKPEFLNPVRVEIKVEPKASDNAPEPSYEAQYETPWDVKNTWLSKLMDNDPNPASNDEPVIDVSNTDQNQDEMVDNKELLDSFDDDDEEFKEDENRLEIEFLGEIQPVIFSPTPTAQRYSKQYSQYGQSIRKFLTRLCSRRGNSEISKNTRLFISCTVARNDLSPYTTMRLIRQFMNGLKNLITQKKNEFSLTQVIENEINTTPKNVFINLDSIIESVLTKSVVKPLRTRVYKLLILEHYKNNNLKLISDGVEASRSIPPEKLGLKNNAKAIIDSKLELIRQKFKLISKQYSPERKIKYMISIVEIVFNMLKLIYPADEVNSMKIDIKSDNILPLFVYIFSQCKLDAAATQCEVEFVEGLIWSTKLVNGEPGFFLLNLMSALEAIKVLARPKISAAEVIDLTDQNAIRINNSSFFTKINPSTVSDAAIGSVNVIILDEKINRLVTKSFPVRSTVTSRNLCSTIAYRLGIFNPSDYSLYKYTGLNESLLNDYDYPLLIKQSHQQKTGENVNFIFKRKNANFILPCDIRIQ